MNKIYQKSLADGKNAGFTLIELLVVVLIIGILAAVALPKYERAVAKSRAAQGIQMLGSIYEAQKLWYMQNGEDLNNSGVSSWDDLSIDLPCKNKGTSGPADNHVLTCNSNFFTYALGGTGGGGRVWYRNWAFYPNGDSWVYVLGTEEDKTFFCCSPEAEKCRNIGMSTPYTKNYSSGVPCYY